MKFRFILPLAAFLLPGLISIPAAETQLIRPNILWITAEDLSPNLGCYGNSFARTPNLDALARKSVRYDQAFATAPVCSPARSCLITGLYATSLGTQNLRSQFAIPSQFKGFPAYLRQAGYFTSNNSKTDYNILNEAEFIKESWDVCGPTAHWRQRKSGQPFFSVFNLMITHQSRASVWSFEEFEKMIDQHLSPGERSDPAQAPIPPYYPDTPVVRRALARYYDCIAAMDKVYIAQILKALEADGLAEDTIVFFYGDHGDGLPRGKRVLHDSGMRVPLLIHFPTKYQRLAPGQPGTATDRLVSFVDFAPTVLSLAGAKIPEYMQGVAFLGKQTGQPRPFVFGARDRVDEAYEVSRSARDSRYLYIRNYLPHFSWAQPEAYSDQSEMRRELVELAKSGQLNAAQLAYAGPRKAMEELYDVRNDPYQLTNLLDSVFDRAGHEKTHSRMRQRLKGWQTQTRDLGFLPEQEVYDRCGLADPFEALQSKSRYDLNHIVSVASMVGNLQHVPKQIELLSDADSAVRYWAAVGLRAAERTAKTAQSALTKALNDPSVSVRIEAAAALTAQDDMDFALKVLEKELQGEHLDSVLHAARILELMEQKAQPALPIMKLVLAQALQKEKQQPNWMFVRFSLEAALKKLAVDRAGRSLPASLKSPSD